MASAMHKTLRASALLGAGAATVFVAPRVWRFMNRKFALSERFNRACELLDHRVGWDKLPTPIGLVSLIGIRHTLREKTSAIQIRRSCRFPRPRKLPWSRAAPLELTTT